MNLNRLLFWLCNSWWLQRCNCIANGTGADSSTSMYLFLWIIFIYIIQCQHTSQYTITDIIWPKEYIHYGIVDLQEKKNMCSDWTDILPFSYNWNSCRQKDFLPFTQSYMPHPRAAVEQPTPSVWNLYALPLCRSSTRRCRNELPLLIRAVGLVYFRSAS